MKIEHIAINVPNASDLVAWYTRHLGLKLVRQGSANQMHFIADDSGQSMLEVYTNPAAPFPDYAAMDPLVLHIAFVVDDIEAERERLLAAGATAVGDIAETPDGDRLAMQRDPWGIAIQLVQRAKPMI